MKIIHTADLHLDSVMKANLDKARAKERRDELSQNFVRLSLFAHQTGAKAILIAGDLFDDKRVSKQVGKTVLNEINRNADIDYYYLKGNHDKDSFVNLIKEEGEVPENLHLFDYEWKKYILNENEDGRKIALYGAEFSGDNNGFLMNTFHADAEDINIVMLHGQENEYRGKDTTDIIPISEMKGKNIDYLALGHVHEKKMALLDSRGTYCYPGCLEGRGFDECGDHGFMLLDVNEENGDVIAEFIDFANRKLHHVIVDLTDCESTAKAVELVREKLSSGKYNFKDLVKIELTGKISEEAEINEEYILHVFKEDFYFLKVKNSVKVNVDYRKYANDESLKGWFIRLVENSEELDEEMKGQVVQMGLRALSGEEIVQ